MYQTSEMVVDGFNCLAIAEKNLGTIATIVPAAGAVLRSWTPDAAAGNNLIDFYDNSQNLAEKITTAGFKSAKLNPFGGRLRQGNYQFNKVNYHTGRFFLGEHALHGLLYDAPFTIINSTSSATEASVSLLHPYTGSNDGFPFCFNCEVTYTFSQNNLSIATRITNLHQQDIPMQDGWHPYFALGGTADQWQIAINSNTRLKLSADLLPDGSVEHLPYLPKLTHIGTRHFDDCYLLHHTDTAACTIYHPQTQLQLQLNALQNYPYLQVYTPPHRQSIALEPMSAPPDCFNHHIGLKIIKPGDSMDFVCSFTVSKK
jgi:aldose 1-epimerase